MESIITVPENSYEDILGVAHGTDEYRRRFDWLKQQLNESAESAARGEFIPIEQITPKRLREYALSHRGEIEEHRKELELYGFR